MTAPARGASTGISIFIDSRTITGSPAATRSPGRAAIWKTTPVMWALISSRIEGSSLDHPRVYPPRPDGGALEHAGEERVRRPDAPDPAGGQRRPHPRDRRVPRLLGGDQ